MRLNIFSTYCVIPSMPDQTTVVLLCLVATMTQAQASRLPGLQGPINASSDERCVSQKPRLCPRFSRCVPLRSEFSCRPARIHDLVRTCQCSTSIGATPGHFDRRAFTSNGTSRNTWCELCWLCVQYLQGQGGRIRLAGLLPSTLQSLRESSNCTRRQTRVAPDNSPDALRHILIIRLVFVRLLQRNGEIRDDMCSDLRV